MRCEQEIQQYCRQVDKLLDCPKASKKAFLQQTSVTLQRLVTEQPQLSYAQAIKCIGAPQDLASFFLETQDAASLARYYRRKQFYKKIFYTVVTLLLVGILSFGIWYICMPTVQEATVINRGTTIYRLDGTVEYEVGDASSE